MKRLFNQITQDENDQQPQVSSLYDVCKKRQKVQQQRIGDFIVNAIDAFHFKIVENES
jgi:hypothetical protein